MFDTVEQHHGQAVAVLGTQFHVAIRGRGIDVGAVQVETQLAGEDGQSFQGATAQAAPGTCQQYHAACPARSDGAGAPMGHGIQYPVTYC